jgi:hypothetical protein
MDNAPGKFHVSLRSLISLCLVAIAIISAPIYLWHTNYCFAEGRYLSKNEICEKFLSKLPKDWLTANPRCVFEVPTENAAFLVFTVNLSPRLYPNTQWGDLLTFYDSCGQELKFH